MTVKEFIQGILLTFCLMATGIVLPIGLVVGSASHDVREAEHSARPVFIFTEAR